MNFHRCSIQTALLDVMWFWTNPIGRAPQLLSGIGLWLQTSFNWKVIVSLNLYCCVCMGWLGCASQVLSCIYVHVFFIMQFQHGKKIMAMCHAHFITTCCPMTRWDVQSRWHLQDFPVANGWNPLSNNVPRTVIYNDSNIHVFHDMTYISRSHWGFVFFLLNQKSHNSSQHIILCVSCFVTVHEKMILLACWVRMPCGMKHPPAAVLGTRCCSPVKCVLLSFTPSTNICCNPHQPVIFGCELKGQIQPMYRNWVIYPS